MGKIIVKQTKSIIGEKPKIRKVVRALGLRKLHKEKVHNDNNCIRGMINKVKHFVEYKLIDD